MLTAGAKKTIAFIALMLSVALPYNSAFAVTAYTIVSANIVPSVAVSMSGVIVLSTLTEEVDFNANNLNELTSASSSDGVKLGIRNSGNLNYTVSISSSFNKVDQHTSISQSELRDVMQAAAHGEVPSLGAYERNLQVTTNFE